jgi:hypothetical protein
MILNQDKQAKLHEELSRVIGEERMIKSADRTQLPYLMATINVSSKDVFGLIPVV